jgi:hypothetical protein
MPRGDVAAGYRRRAPAPPNRCGGGRCSTPCSRRAPCAVAGCRVMKPLGVIRPCGTASPGLACGTWPRGPTTPRSGRRAPPRGVPPGRAKAAPRRASACGQARPRPSRAPSWRRRAIQAGSQGPLAARMTRVRVVAVREGWPGPEVRLVLRRHPMTGELKTSLCHAPTHTPLATLGRLSGMRWPLETCVEDGKQSLGLGDDEVRSWRGWHHHMPLVILAHCSLVRLRRRVNKGAGPDLAPSAGVAARGPAPARL